MDSIIFFDVSISQNSNVISNGSIIGIDDLIKLKLRQHPNFFENKVLLNNFDLFDLNGIEKTAYWDKIMSTMIFCLSGQIPDYQEVLRGRQIIYQLPKWFKKKNLTRQFILGFLPYILIGFKIHVGDCFQSDSNCVGDICRFILRIYSLDQAEIISFLCAHRGFSALGSHTLVNFIKQDRARRTLNLQMAILANMPRLKDRKICWYQQGFTEMASSNMFPEMFIQYLVSGDIPELLMILRRHFAELKFVFRRNSDLVSARVINLDLFTKSIHAFLNSQFGSNWRIINFELDRRIKQIPLVGLALDKVIPEIKRLIPFYGSSFASDFLKTREEYLIKNLLRAREIETTKKAVKNLEIKTRETIDWFYSNQLMHITAKALYEATFYYIWGRMVAIQPYKIAIGIDRDHAQYQNLAWNMGYCDTKNSADDLSAVILYSRRAETEKPKSALKNISFRQFWR